MDIKSNHKKSALKHPYLKANFLSRITFLYVNTIILKYLKKSFTEDDLYETIPQLDSQMLGDDLENIWKENVKKGKSSVFRMLLSYFGKEYFIYTFFCILFYLIRTFLQPILITNILLYFSSSHDEKSSTFKYAVASATGLIIFYLVSNVFTQYCYFIIHRQGLQMAIGLSSLIYRKSLRLKTDSKSLNDNLEGGGNIVTLITKDALLFDNTINCYPDMVNFLIAFLLATFLIYQKIGLVGFTTTAIIIIMIFFQLIFGKKIYDQRTKVAIHTAARLEFIREVLSAIKIIKMYTWESFFIKKINNTRKEEMKGIYILYLLKFFTFIIGTICSSCVFYILFIVYISIHKTINTETLFYVMILLDNLKFYFTMAIPLGITATGEMFSAIKRIEDFLLLEEVIKVERNKILTPKLQLNKITIKLSSSSFKVSFCMEKEGLILVTGPISVGKTILLKTILGEYAPVEGSIKVDGKLSYASQEPWLFPSTIKQNIVFGEEVNQKRYEEILDICNLQYDIERFEKKDESIVTDRGVNLSKGQQARITLARALYRQADIYLIDDCFNSLDNKVGAEVFQKTVEFLKNKIVLIVSQNPMHFEHMPKKVFLITSTEAFLLDNYILPKEKHKTLNDLPKIQEIDKTNNIHNENIPQETTSHESDTLLTEIPRENIYHEDIAEGFVSMKIIYYYMKCCGGITIFFISILFFIAFAVLDILSYRFLSTWVNNEEQLLNYEKQIISSTLESDQKYLNLLGQKNKYFIAYNIVFALAIVFGLLRTICLFYITSKASIRIHKKMIEAVLKAQMTFFDTNLLGNIINRFSKDVYNLDENVPSFFFQVILMSLDLIFLLILIATMGWFYVILATASLLIVLLLLKYIYSGFASCTKRLESAVHSSLVGYLNSSFLGLEIIRVHENEDQLITEFDHHQDKFASGYFLIVVLGRSAATTMDFLTYLLLGSTYIYIFLKENVTAAEAGLVLSVFTRMFIQLVVVSRQTVEFFSFMTSIERTINYTKIKTESNKGLGLSLDWPKDGAIQISNLGLKYPSNHLETLNGINVNIKAKEKVAIIGRTGSGKSSIISSLFHLYDFKGRILIDEVDIKCLSLSYRSKLGIIPQEPVIFSGSIRENLDPYGQFTDDQLWKALKKVKFDAKNLNEDIRDLKLSTGQKQLICLVRILLEEKKIVILDEATSNMDLQTERFICEILKENLKDCTVLTIAHKLETIKDAEKVLVLHNGQLNSYEF